MSSTAVDLRLDSYMNSFCLRASVLSDRSAQRLSRPAGEAEARREGTVFTSPAARFLPELAYSVVIPFCYPSIRRLLLRPLTIGLRARMPMSVTVGGSGTAVMAATAREIG